MFVTPYGCCVPDATPILVVRVVVGMGRLPVTAAFALFTMASSHALFSANFFHPMSPWNSETIRTGSTAAIVCMCAGGGGGGANSTVGGMNTAGPNLNGAPKTTVAALLKHLFLGLATLGGGLQLLMKFRVLSDVKLVHLGIEVPLSLPDGLARVVYVPGLLGPHPLPPPSPSWSLPLWVLWSSRYNIIQKGERWIGLGEDGWDMQVEFKPESRDMEILQGLPAIAESASFDAFLSQLWQVVTANRNFDSPKEADNQRSHQNSCIQLCEDQNAIDIDEADIGQNVEVAIEEDVEESNDTALGYGDVMTFMESTNSWP
ncbi:hypothetical protein BDN67DRAFT_984953 [Paxillus ammoniavirescens]|nr:hypothetical protein BDN67DRAFT_984953 [Paxillus ammoniavirescens]